MVGRAHSHDKEAAKRGQPRTEAPQQKAPVDPEPGQIKGLPGWKIAIQDGPEPVRDFLEVGFIKSPVQVPLDLHRRETGVKGLDIGLFPAAEIRDFNLVPDPAARVMGIDSCQELLPLQRGHHDVKLPENGLPGRKGAALRLC